MRRKTWKDVDWVELGCRGWVIDETGAGLYDPPEPDEVQGDVGHAHLDFKTLDLILCGLPDFVERVIADLRAAGALNVFTAHWLPDNTTTGNITTGTTLTTAVWRRSA